MKWLVILFISIFAFNILGEVSTGHCDETGTENLEAVIHNQTDHVDHSDQAPCSHVCHLGHCGHLLLIGTNFFEPMTLSSDVGQAETQAPHWRILPSLFRPPIV